MDKSITDNAVEQIAVNPDQTAQVIENSDKFENKAELLQAVFDPNVVTLKSNKSLNDMTEWQKFVHDPWIAYESNDPRYDRFKPFADLSRDPEWYSLAQKYGKDIVFKTDTILGYMKPAPTGLGRFIEGYNYAADSLRLADREASLSDARAAGNYAAINKLENEIAEIKYRMANDEAPLQSKSWSSVADISASSLRNMPEILGINILAGLLAAPTGGASLAVGRVGIAATIYDDTFSVEFGSLLREIMEKNPDMPEAEAREMATKGARVNALIESLPSLIPGLDVTAGIGKRAAQTVLGKVTKKALAQAAKANPTGFRKWLSEALKVLGEYGVEVGSESVQEVLQEISGQSAVSAATEGGDFYKMSEDRLINFITDPFGEQNQDLWDVFGYTSLGSGVLEGVTGLVFGGAGRARRLGRMGNRNRQTLQQQGMGGVMNRTLADQLFQQRQNSEMPAELQTEANKRMQARGIVPDTVRIDKDVARALSVDPEVANAMRELGIQAALADSEENGGVVEVDFSKYDDIVNTNEALFQKIRDAVSFSPETVSFAEFQKYIKMLDAKAIGEIERARQDSESVYNRILSIAKQAGVDQQVAESYAVMAQLQANRIGTFRMGRATSGEEAARRLEIRWAGVEPEITTPAQAEIDVAKPTAFRKGGAIRPTDWVDYTVPQYTGGETLPSTYTKAGKLKNNVLKSIKALFTPEELAYEYTTSGETSNLEGLIESTFSNPKYAKASPADNAVRQMAKFHKITPAQMYNMIMLARGEPTKEFPADNEAYYTDEKIEVDGKERPTLDSNRNPIAYTKQELIEFWRWFGDSKATDGLDRPVAVVKDTSVEGKWGEGIYFKETEDTNTNYGFLKIETLADYDTYSYTDETITEAFNKEGIDGATNYNGVWAVKQENQFREAAPVQTQEGRVLHQFVGEKANLEKEAPELAKRLARAKELEAEGKTDEEIFNETHIRRAPDGKFRVQISDAAQTGVTGDTIVVDGVERPTKNSDGQQIPPQMLEQFDLADENARLDDWFNKNITKGDTFTTNEGVFTNYQVKGDNRNMSTFTVFESPDGWIVRNAYVPENLQKKGIATKFYQVMNSKSLESTGKPLRSTQPRTLKSGEQVFELSELGKGLWDSLEKKGLARKLENGTYEFNKEPTLLFQEQFDLAAENARLDEIYPAYDGETIEVDGKERTVYNSNGDRIAKSKEALTNFWRWFGDSKVVDEQGRPLVVYHGARGKTDITEFRPQEYGYNVEATYFATNKRAAGHWAQSSYTKRNINPDEYMKRVYETDSVKELLDMYNSFGAKTEIVEYDGFYRLNEHDGMISSPLGKKITESTFEVNGRTIDLVKELQRKISRIVYDSANSDLYSVYAKLENPLIVDAKKQPYHSIEFNGEKTTTATIAQFALDNNYDGLIIKNVYETDYENVLTDDVLAFEPTQIKSVDNVGTWSPTDARVLHQFVGEKANLEKEAPELAKRLARAKELEAEGKTDEEIFNETHIRRAPDGKFRVQISDAEARMSPKARKWLKRTEKGRLSKVPLSKGMTLGDIFEHDLLFALYPQLKDLPVSVSGEQKTYASRDRDGNSFINLSVKEAPYRIRQSILHEVQHVIQRYESWARGGPTSDSQRSGEAYRERARLLRLISGDLRDNNVLTYWAASKTGEGFLYVGEEEFRAMQDSPAVKELAEKDPEFAKRVERVKELNEELKSADSRSSEAQYMRLFGEAEARLTEKLSFKSQEELDQLDPYGYFDVSEFIVKDQEGNLITTVAAPENTQTTGEFFIEFDADAAEAIFGKKITAGKFYREGDKLVIELTPNANATTFIHELFHWFSYELLDAYNSGEMTEYWASKVELLAKMVGAEFQVDPVDPTVKRLYLTDKQEDKAADMFLEYIREGKVQNREVKPLFAYLQDVFKKIYKLLGLQQYKLSPEAMELFDSIFRAQDVIEDEHRIVGLIAIDKPEGADQGLYDMYTGEMLNSRVRATQELHKTWAGIEKFQQSKEYEQKRNEVRLEVAQELNQETRYIVVDEYQKQNGNAAATWLALQANPETEDLDLSLEKIAEIVENTPDKTAEIDRITNERMNEYVMEKYKISPEEFGLRESRNTSKVRALLAEALMREGKTINDFDAEYSQLLEKADNQVAKSSLNRLADKQYWNNLEARIVERYAYALSQNDQKAMAEARKDQAIVNAIRMRAESIVTRAKRFREQAEKFNGKQPKVSYEVNGEKVYEYKYGARDYDLLQSILEKFGFSINYARRKQLPVGQKLDEWIDEQEATTITRAGELRNFIPFINEGFDGEFQYMSGADFEKLEAVFNAVKSVAGAKYSILLKNDKILLSSLVASTAKNMNDMGVKPFKKKDNYWARTFGTFGKFTNPEAIVRKLFPQDVLNKVWLPFIDAGVKAERYTREWVDAYRAAKGKVSLNNVAKTYSTGQTLTNKQVADLLLSMGNQHAYDNMRLSLGVYLGGELTEAQAEAIVSEALQDQPALADFVKEVWAIYGEAAKQLDKEFEERTNTLFVEKDHRSFEINGIKFGGGYVPVRKELDYLPTDPRAVNQGGMVHDKKFEKLVTKKPDGNMRSIVDITENELSQSARQGYTAVEYNNARKYLLANGTKAAIGERAFAFLRDWLTSYMMPKYDTTGWVRPFATLTTIGALGFRISTALLQLSGLGPACATLGPTYFARGIAMAFRNNEWVPVLATKRGAKKSDYMLVRIGDPRSSLLGQSITDAVRSTDANTKAGKYAKVAFGKVGQAAMGLIQQVDTIVANITWNGAYLKALDSGMSEEEARREADSVVRTVQSDSLEVSRSVAMQGPMARMVTAFATWIMAMQSMLRAQIATRRYGQAVLWAGMYMFISPVFESFLKEATKIGGDDDDKDYLERVLQTCYNEIASTMGNSILPFAGFGGAGLTAILEGAWEGVSGEKGPFDMRQANVPALQAAGRAFSAARYALAGKMDKAAYYGTSMVSMEMGRLVKYLLAE